MASAIIDIDPGGDVLISVHGDRASNSGHAKMRVSRKVLILHSDYFKALFSGRYKESNEKGITLKEDSPISIELWFRALHGNMIDAHYELPTKYVWETIQLAKKYDLCVQKLESWFAQWYERLNIRTLALSDLVQLLLPCQTFNHARGLANVSARLARHCKGRIECVNRRAVDNQNFLTNAYLCTPDAINHARTSIRRQIEHQLLNVLPKFCKNTCSAMAESRSLYIDAISLTGIWPLGNNSVSNNDILESKVMLDWNCAYPDDACKSCKEILRGAHVFQLREGLKGYWQGLCLDCMDRSGFTTGETEREFWDYATANLWSRYCRVKHARNSWYFSFMGRSEQMSKWMKDNSWDREQKRKERIYDALTEALQNAVQEHANNNRQFGWT
ncbi:hypothetical protein PVAG01_04652 [Phlyctema vagabunda]|uniref:BTB domain-containing protein n=1 Tax=Phlyctema vagabunda TaxID=108571 RepID=A0ABR4PHY2_9HELO